MKNLLKSSLPHLAAIGIFAVVMFVYFLPAFQGYRLVQSDLKTAQGAAQEAKFYEETTGDFTAWTNSMFSGMPAFQISNYTDFDGNLAGYVVRFWNLLIPQPAGIWLMYALSFYVLLLALKIRQPLAVVGSLAFAFSSYFIIILEVGHITKALAVSYVPFLFAGFVWLLDKKYVRGLWVMALAFAVELYSNHVQITYYFGILLLIFGIAYAFKAGKEHAWIHLSKVAVLSVLAAIIGIMCNFSALYNTYEYSKETTRSQSELTIAPEGSSASQNKTTGLDKDYITAWSYGIQESFTLIVPNAKGGATGMIGDQKALDKADPQFRTPLSQQNHYWGDQSFTEGPVYLGAGIALLFVVALFFVEGYLKWTFFIGFVLSLALSWGKNFMPLTDFFIDHVPGYNKFRAVTIIMVVLEFCAPLLAVLFVNELIAKREDWLAKKNWLLYSGGGVLALLLLFYVIPDSLFDFFNGQEADALNKQAQDNPEMAATIQQFIKNLKTVRIAIFKEDVIRSIFFAGATFALIYFYLTKGFKAIYLIVALGLITTLDLFTVNRRYLNGDKQNGRFVQWEEKKENQFPFLPTAFDEEIYRLETSGLAINGNANTLFVPAVELQKRTEQNLQSRKERRLARGILEPMSDAEQAAVKYGTLNLHSNYRVLNLSVSTFNDASTSYFHKSLGGYHGAKLKRYQELIDFYFAGSIQPNVVNMLNAKYIVTQQGVQFNGQALGNAWFVKEVQWVKDANEEILALKALDPKSKVIVDNRFKAVLGQYAPDSSATISQVSYAPNKLVYRSNCSQPQVAVFSEIYSPGWSVTIDGKPAEAFRCDYVLRGLSVPAGEHSIEFVYRPSTIETGNRGSMAGSVMLILVTLVGLWTERKKLVSGN